MTSFVASSVQTDTWVRIGSDIEITYEVWPVQDDVVFAFDGLSMNMGQAGLRRCIATFTEALSEFETAARTGSAPAATGSGGEARDGA